jgi:hypothetical protein
MPTAVCAMRNGLARDLNFIEKAECGDYPLLK